MNEDLSEWNNSLNKQLQYEQEKNKLSIVCKRCGHKGYYLSKEPSSLGYDCLCLNLCNCVIGTNLKDKWIRQDEERKKKTE
jgi:hypothetical protein